MKNIFQRARTLGYSPCYDMSGRHPYRVMKPVRRGNQGTSGDIIVAEHQGFSTLEEMSRWIDQQEGAVKESKAERIVEKLKRGGYEAEVRPDYSGRAMFGATTTAVVTNARPNQHPATAGLVYDQMGKDRYVYY